MMGISACAAWRSRSSKWMIATSLTLCAIAAILAVTSAHNGLDRSGPMAVAALFAASLPWLILAETRAILTTPPVLRFLGDASYSIYLVHALPLLVLGHGLAAQGWQVIFPVAVIVGVAVGIAYHILIEAPLLARIPRRLS